MIEFGAEGFTVTQEFRKAHPCKSCDGGDGTHRMCPEAYVEMRVRCTQPEKARPNDLA